METPPAAKWDGDERHASFTPTSISDMLKLCEADPIELLMDLGFGIDEPDICTKIPTRFIMTPSEAKGINTRVFLEAQKRRMEIENPNLCGRFRQLEVLEQVTSAFSSLLNDVHVHQNGENKNVKKSSLTQEKRKRIRQLLWKFSRQAKIADDNPGPCTVNDDPIEKQDQCEPLKDTANINDFSKRTHSTDQEKADDLSKEKAPATENANGSPLSHESSSTPCGPVKQYNINEITGKIRTLRGSKVLSKTFRKAQNRLQPPESFELEEVQSFEEDYPKALNQDRILEVTRTNSCQSDSSGFQEDPPEPLPLKNLHGSSDSIDSLVTLHGKSNSSDFPDISEEYDEVHDIAAPPVTENAAATSTNHSLQTDKDLHTSLSMNTENSIDLFQSFESHNDHSDRKKEMEKKISIPGDTVNEMEELSTSVNYLQDGQPEDKMDHGQTQTPVEYPVYVTHYLSDIRKIQTELSSETDDQDGFGGCVSDLQIKSDSESNSFADDECSVVSSVKWTSSPKNRRRFSFQAQTPPGSVDYSDHELNHCYQNNKNTFQTEINTNIYKSVTIQMSSNLLQDPGEHASRQHSVYGITNNRNEVHALLTRVDDKKDAFSQTEIGLLNECCANNHCSHQRSHYLTESLSFDTGLWNHHHLSHPAPNIACCHCCHCHHCCISRCPNMRRHNVHNRPSSSHINIEKELSDTLNMLRESLISVSLVCKIHLFSLPLI